MWASFCYNNKLLLYNTTYEAYGRGVTMFNVITRVMIDKEVLSGGAEVDSIQPEAGAYPLF